MLNGNLEQQNLAHSLQIELDALELKNLNQPTQDTPNEFADIVNQIRQSLDPHLRLINNGTLIEIHSSNPPWKVKNSLEWLKNEMENSDSPISQLASQERQITSGLAKNGENEFNFLLICKTNKGITTKKHIEEKLKDHPRALIITIGDTQLDYPMHHNAHLAFHVGLEEVWRNNSLSKCVMIRNQDGEGQQHVDGTLRVLKLLEEGIGKSFYELKYIPKQDELGKWNYYSIKVLNLITHIPLVEMKKQELFKLFKISHLI